MVKRKILVVDDQAVNRRLLERLLEKEYEVCCAQNGAEALELLRTQADTISAVLMDIVMPVLDGYAVLAAMKQDKTLSQIPVIVSSQKDDEESEVKALALGAQDFIAKPYKADVIRHRLANTIKLRETAAMVNSVTRDALTGLYNKEFFVEKVSEALAADGAAAVNKYDLVCLNIRKLKVLNDTFGFAAGDRLLRRMGRMMLENRTPDTLCGYYGGGMFYVLAPRAARFLTHNSVWWNERLREIPAEEGTENDERDLQLTVSCGVCPLDTPETLAVPVADLCDRARMAADSLRGTSGREAAYYDAALSKRMQLERFITRSMKRALEAHEFEVYYQPKYDLSAERVAGAEALVRWNSPKQGFISPGEFIPLFEKNGFITRLDRFVWETVCADMHRWIVAGNRPTAVSVNVSRADIYHPELYAILTGLVEKYQIPVACLHLEITETAYADNSQQLIEIVSRLRDYGFLIEMDDFGSGYSSLNMLAEMPVDLLKLDMRFIQQESRRNKGRGILSFIISLAKWLDLAVIAEGVETREQIDTLRRMDCNYVQGYYYAKPMPREEFEKHLLENPRVEMVYSSSVAALLPPAGRDRLQEEGGIMLIVDDVAVNRATLANAFRDEFAIVEKADGQQGWDFLDANYEKVEVIMLDLLMPVMDGFQMLERIRTDSRTAQLPVIITSQGDEASERRALALRADDFISKPYNPDLIHHRVQNVVANYRLGQIATRYDLTRQLSELDRKHYFANATHASHAARAEIERLQCYFDIVRLVDPDETSVYDLKGGGTCQSHACFSVWGKSKRCSNCISMRALHRHGRCTKLEYSDEGLFFVISQYIPYGKHGAVLEMVTKLEREYVDNVFDKEMLYSKMDVLNQKLTTDELTGVNNRRYLDENLDVWIEQARAEGSAFSVAMVDMDRLKHINDTYGHIAGDEAIRKTARKLSAHVVLNRGDGVARFGGDEFLAVCRGDAAELCRRMNGVCAALAQESVGGTNEVLRISYGTADLAEMPQADATEMIRAADRYLYEMKEKHRAAAAEPGTANAGTV